MANIYDLPPDLPRPIDDGQADHLPGAPLPDVQLESTLGKPIRILEHFRHPTILFIYPRAGSPLEPNTNQELWDRTPGARGCTPQSCGFRDLHGEFQSIGIAVFGLSIQPPHVQAEFVERNHIPFTVLSDSRYELTEGLRLPTFVFEGERLIKRMALFIEAGKIQKVFYPVFPPDRNAEEVLSWLRAR